MNKALTYYRENEVVKNELYTTQVTELTVKESDFHSIYPNLYPAKQITNAIGSASGVEFLSNQRMDTVYGDVIQNPDGSQTKKPCGLRCTKQGQKMKPDGSMQISSPCTYEFNWEDRAELDFIASEESGNNKYTTELKKRKHILELKKFASQRASTGAELMVIRELTGMPTAFKKQELVASDWKMKFSQIVKSTAHQTLEARARLDNIRNGGTAAMIADNAASELMGGSVDTQSDFDTYFEKPTAQTEDTMDGTVESSGDSAPCNIDPEKSEKQEIFESLLNDKRITADPGMVKHYSDTVMNAEYSEQALDWAIGELQTFLGGY